MARPEEEYRTCCDSQSSSELLPRTHNASKNLGLRAPRPSCTKAQVRPTGLSEPKYIYQSRVVHFNINPNQTQAATSLVICPRISFLIDWAISLQAAGLWNSRQQQCSHQLGQHPRSTEAIIEHGLIHAKAEPGRDLEECSIGSTTSKRACPPQGHLCCNLIKTLCTNSIVTRENASDRQAGRAETFAVGTIQEDFDSCRHRAIRSGIDAR